MADGLPGRSGALKQIYEIAAERWQHWDSDRKGPTRSRGQNAGGRSSRRASAQMPHETRSHHGSSGPRAAISATERRQALRLRQQGRSLREISQELSRPVSTARRLVAEAHPATIVSHAELKLLDRRVTRIERILMALGKVLKGLEPDSPSRRRTS